MKTTILLLAYTCENTKRTSDGLSESIGASDGTATIQLNYSTTQEYADEYTEGIKRMRAYIASQSGEGVELKNFTLTCIHSWTVGI